ncbi:hypothetical protein Nepgr_009978 [Nepenthes gracilis]|uniref:Uncharacterized protein n=1 Tax=Nepenthes gracilis TaxID=150966 RepID=A0AAD3SBJ3_NEPGR|nr:hypothetical protein Nepgr_009978 [Nepenthes gracilis]
MINVAKDSYITLPRTAAVSIQLEFPEREMGGSSTSDCDGGDISPRKKHRRSEPSRRIYESGMVKGCDFVVSRKILSSIQPDSAQEVSRYPGFFLPSIVADPPLVCREYELTHNLIVYVFGLK